MENSKRKFNTDSRKKLVTKIGKLLSKTKSKNDSINIYSIINEDIGDNYSSNRNGIFINMNILSDTCIQKLIDYIEEQTCILSQTETEKPTFKLLQNNFDEIVPEMGQKLSNQEKHIIKRIRNNEKVI
jgi:hypothetical protein